MSETPSCFHCGLPVPKGSHYAVEIDGESRAMCCPGCQAVAQAIVDNGLTDYYRYRTEQSPMARQLVPEVLKNLELYDRDDIQQSFVSGRGDYREASLILEGIVCAACIWLSEHHIMQLPGVVSFSVNYATHRAQVKWDQRQIQLSEILKAISDIGYLAHPLDPNRQEQVYKREKSAALRRLAVAGVGAMQIMMIAVALYASVGQGMDANLKLFLRWVSLLIAMPVIAYSAKPFFIGMWRDLKMRRLGMDVPVALAIGAAFAASAWATIMRHGEIYFDSVTMFTFFLLAGRFLEMSARHRAGQAAEELVKLIPAMATRLSSDDKQEVVPVSELRPGDIVLIKPGESIPADGISLGGTSSVDESLLTGESLPISKHEGDQLIGGSVNIESNLQMRVQHVGQDTVLASIQRLLDRAQSEKPRLAELADRVAGYFVAVLLLLAVAVGLYWWQVQPQEAFWIVISVLVVTCPCALSLATPVALTAATGRLTRDGILTTRGHALETLARVTDVVFDKTGTLTRGQLSLDRILLKSDVNETLCLQIAMALERHSEHPLAKAILQSRSDLAALPAEQVQAIPGQGLRGTIAGKRYIIGNPGFIAQHLNQVAQQEHTHTTVVLADAQRVLAEFIFSDQLRPGVAQAIAGLKQLGCRVHLFSGDRKAVVQRTAEEIGIDHATGEMTPADKLSQLHALQESGAVVAMVGDGVNDAPVLAGAQVSLAMGSGTQIAQASADMVLLSEDLGQMVDALQVARQTRRIIRENLAWAVVYNLVALPLAAAGWVAPWMAAIGMSVSSLLVVLNALRLTQRSKKPVAGDKLLPAMKTG
ncbi:MAG: cadmium-translocating P-type ATPase [Gammaproteobacteria bacterium]|nr:cadmium-translocating P-type ATPase [Gammaproteobacteria bacterium]